MPLEEHAKQAILARRARFLAAAVASAGIVVACEKQDTRPVACLTPIAVEDAASEDAQPSTAIDARPKAPGPDPLPCLSPMTKHSDAGAMPQICLSDDFIEEK